MRRIVSVSCCFCCRGLCADTEFLASGHAPKSAWRSRRRRLGLAHIGVLKWFEEHHIPVDYVAGTSMGGLVADFTPRE